MRGRFSDRCDDPESPNEGASSGCMLKRDRQMRGPV